MNRHAQVAGPAGLLIKQNINHDLLTIACVYSN